MTDKVKILREFYGLREWILGILPVNQNGFSPHSYESYNFIWTTNEYDALEMPSAEARRLQRQIVNEGGSAEIDRDD